MLPFPTQRYKNDDRRGRWLAWKDDRFVVERMGRGSNALTWVNWPTLEGGAEVAHASLPERAAGIQKEPEGLPVL